MASRGHCNAMPNLVVIYENIRVLLLQVCYPTSLLLYQYLLLTK